MVVIISKVMLLTKTISFSQNNYSRYDCQLGLQCCRYGEYCDRYKEYMQYIQSDVIRLWTGVNSHMCDIIISSKFVCSGAQY